MIFPAAAAILLSSFVPSAYAHMELTFPAPFRSKSNPNVQNPDFDMTSPLAASGANFPCKGYHSDLGTPAGAPTADFPAGSVQEITISGGAAHNGGSCQFALSYDGGQTFKVIQSNIGNCVNPGGTSSFPVTIPSDVPSGEAIFAWIWHNNTGNREIYMNCAAVTVSGGGSAGGVSALADRPDIFVANLATTTCKVPEGTDVIFPNPGANVVRADSQKLGEPQGDCGEVVAAPPAIPAPEPPAASSSAVVPPPPPASTTAIFAPPASSSAPAVPAPSGGVAPPPTCEIVPRPPQAPFPAPGDGLTYTVVSGDICDTIAAANGVTVASLLSNNPAINAGCTNLAVGQVLNLRRRSRIMRALKSHEKKSRVASAGSLFRV